MDKSNKHVDSKFNNVIIRLRQLQANIELIYAMEEDNRTYTRCMDVKAKEMQKQLVNISREQFKQYKQLKEIQDNLRKIEKRK